MPPQLALIGGILYIIWLFVADRQRQGRFVGASWIPLIWFLIITIKPPEVWLGAPAGSTFGTLTFAVLILGGFRTLLVRRVPWQSIFSKNKWLFIYFLYAGTSVIWSDQTFASIRLWIKDVGNIVVVLVILSERNPSEVVKTTLLRSVYIFVTLSLILVKYFPDLGRTYGHWDYSAIIIGASADKNSLGATLLILALALLWSFSDLQKSNPRGHRVTVAHLLMIALTLWLLIKSHCATALACVMVGTCVFFVMGWPWMRNLARRLGLSMIFVIPLTLLCLQMAFQVGDAFIGILGRDITLTGRSSIWESSLGTNINPLFGAGYCSFWYGDRAKTISDAMGFFYGLKEAHNGYLEIYLNGGLLGLFLLMGALGSGAKKLLKRSINGGSYDYFRLAILAMSIIYNVSESAFGGLSPIWFMLLLVLVEFPTPRRAKMHQSNEFSKDIWRAPQTVS